MKLSTKFRGNELYVSKNVLYLQLNKKTMSSKDAILKSIRTLGARVLPKSARLILFGLNFVKTGIISSELGKFYSQLFELRQTGDYDDWKVVTENDIMPLVPTAELFLDTLESLIKE